ncbi:transcription termination/antitermination protein NusG [Bradyrhizobium sp. SZCCHNRI1003]|uniref:transcription termination/antitermination protein NusG n=1 Tax=Bradyrhizobium sp. SZCCHNRI1003 TaxID=3057275 RepID=UPI002916A338|nr:transcription termination/antitermination NusG family protein [Bradyrhizobium sp. SZCCHNRI1003]
MSEIGNLSEVRAQLSEWRKGQVVGFVDPCDRRNAEIVPKVSARWHVIETHPNHERTAAAHLIARRFGVYLPETECDVVRRGKKVHVTPVMFPGYLFVFVWDIDRHWSRIVSNPGVAGIMTLPDASGARLPVVMSDALIDYIRIVENGERSLPDILVLDDIDIGKKKRRRWRKDRIGKRKLTQDDIICVRTWDAFRDGISSLDSEERNQTLMTALSLPSKQPLCISA